MTGYSVSIAKASKELSAKERIQLKDTTSAMKLDEVTQTEAVIIHPAMYAELDIHNEMSDNKDYKNYKAEHTVVARKIEVEPRRKEVKVEAKEEVNKTPKKKTTTKKTTSKSTTPKKKTTTKKTTKKA